MTLTLNLQTRVNLVALLDMQTGNLGTIRLCTKLAEKIELSETEKRDIGYRLVPGPNGIQLPAWRTDATLPDRSIELGNGEQDRLRTLIEECQFFRRADLEWINPLLAFLSAT